MVLFILFLGGIVLIFVEVFLTPGFGVAGISGVILLASSIVWAFMKADSTIAGYFTLIALSVFLIILAGVVKFWPKSKGWKKLILNTAETKSSGFSSSSPDMEKWLGKTGSTISILRPSGVAEIEGVKLDVVTKGEFIPPHSQIKVIKVEGNRIVVERVE